MINTATIVGNITKEIELKYMPSGVALATFAVAVNKYGKDAMGNRTTKSSYIDCKVWGATADFLHKNATKGVKVCVSGELEQEVWTARDGSKRSRIVINARDVELMQTRQAGGQAGGQAQYQQPPAQPAPQPQQRPARPAPTQQQMDMGDEEIPF